MNKVEMAELIAGAKSGCVVSFPTDTVPALAVLPEKSELIFNIKQRQQDKPLILMGASPDSLWEFVQGSADEWNIWQQVAQKYWPGALTLVLPASSRVPVAINPTDRTTIGLRIPNQAIALEILAQTGPLATTSANKSGEPALLNMTEIAANFPEVFTLFTDESTVNSAIGVPSTVAKWTGNGWKILRQGAVKLEV